MSKFLKTNEAKKTYVLTLKNRRNSPLNYFFNDYTLAEFVNNAVFRERTRQIINKDIKNGPFIYEWIVKNYAKKRFFNQEIPIVKINQIIAKLQQEFSQEQFAMKRIAQKQNWNIKLQQNQINPQSKTIFVFNKEQKRFLLKHHIAILWKDNFYVRQKELWNKKIKLDEFINFLLDKTSFLLFLPKKH